MGAVVRGDLMEGAIDGLARLRVKVVARGMNHPFALALLPDGDALISERPGGMLAGGAAAEIVAGNQDARLGILRPVEHEIEIFRPIRPRFQLIEKALGEPCAFRRLQELFRDDHVGVDIGHGLALVHQRRGGSV